MAGYSGTPLAKKLGVGEGTRVRLLNAPPGFEREIAGAEVTPRIDTRTDVIHIFEKSRAGLAKALKDALAKMRRDAVIWVSWPKKASKVPTEITEDTIREVALPMGLVDVKVCAVDEIWSGLKLVIRKENR
jgi:trehalose-6-phosphate synthase